MRLQPVEANRKVISPLQFELVADRENVFDHLIALRQSAMKKFDKVSKIFRVYNEDCIPSRADDRLLDLKIMSQNLMVRMKRLITVLPKSIAGFAFAMPNMQIGFMALATYPDVIELKDGLMVETGLHGRAAWCGMIETFHPDLCSECAACCSPCARSHRLVCELLEVADRQRILSEVHDSTHYWMERDVKQLEGIGRLIRDGKVEYLSPVLV